MIKNYYNASLIILRQESGEYSFCGVFLLFSLVFWVLLQNHEVLHRRNVRKELFGCKFCSVTVTDEHWSRVLLESSNPSWLSCCSDNIYCLTNSDLAFLMLKLIVERHQHAWIHR